MNGLQIGQIVIIQVDTETEEQASIAPVHYLEITELKERNRVIGLGGVGQGLWIQLGLRARAMDTARAEV